MGCRDVLQIGRLSKDAVGAVVGWTLGNSGESAVGGDTCRDMVLDCTWNGDIGSLLSVRQGCCEN